MRTGQTKQALLGPPIPRTTFAAASNTMTQPTVERPAPRDAMWLAACLLVACAAWSLPAAADTGTPGLAAELICKPDPKLIICNLPLATAGGFVSWADATIVEAPTFVHPVWSYSNFKRDGMHEPKLHFGLVPKSPGKGTLAVRLRVSLCPTEGNICANVNRVLKATVIAK